MLSRLIGGLRVAQIMSRNHPRILMYHRVYQNIDNGGIHIDKFRNQIRLIRKHFNVLSLDSLVKAIDEGKTPTNSVVITFDDGYNDFYENAFPITQELGVPVTLFVTTGFVNDELWLWPDKIDYALNKTQTTKFSFQGKQYLIPSPSDCKNLWRSIGDYCLTLGNQDKHQYIDRLFDDLGVDIPLGAPKQYESVTWDQLNSMLRNGLEIGSHSHTHPILTKIDRDSLRYELGKSRDLILERTGYTPKAFCYPNGQRFDFDKDIQNLVKEFGYEYAVAAYPDKYPIMDRWAINRYPASSKSYIFERMLFGLTYLKMRHITPRFR